MQRRRAENARSIFRKFVAERFVFTPKPAGGYPFRGTGDLAYAQLSTRAAPDADGITL